MLQRTDDEILEDLKDWPVRNIYVERGVRLIEQLRQRITELEKDRDAAISEIGKVAREITTLITERDKATQYWQIAEGRCDALHEEVLEWANRFISLWNNVEERKWSEGMGALMRKWAAEVGDVYRGNLK